MVFYTNLRLDTIPKFMLVEDILSSYLHGLYRSVLTLRRHLLVLDSSVAVVSLMKLQYAQNRIGSGGGQE